MIKFPCFFKFAFNFKLLERRFQSKQGSFPRNWLAKTFAYGKAGPELSATESSLINFPEKKKFLVE